MGEKVVHTCHARGCEIVTPRRMFMCKRHWFMVPPKMRRKIWKHYAPGQESNWDLVSDKYLKWTRRAIEYVWEVEHGHAA